MTLTSLLFSRHATLTTPQIMALVLAATVPGVIAMTAWFGPGTLINIAWLALCAVALEAAVLCLRQRPVAAGLGDYSALVTAVLLALSMPPAAPWWAGLVGAFFAIVIAKQLYGGLGANPFNPAMVGYAALLIAFPVEMTRWVLPSGTGPGLPAFGDAMAQFLGNAPDTMDAFTGATALDRFKLDRAGMTVDEFVTGNPLFGVLSGTGWEWVNAAFLLGGLYLLWRRLISWHIPVTMLAAMTLMSLFFYDGGSSASHGSPVFHVFGGATMLGAFFIATDPVTGPATTTGKLWYGALIGTLVYCIRVWGSYPDGVAFAVLLANFAAPAIDQFVHMGRAGNSRAG